ncbi:MAG: ATPase [Gammaproteobacteria bacterium]|nr:ATPase [Gammaproteobacteria bacterium]
MHMSAKQFRDWEHKAITILGMSGVGKTTLSNHLPQSSWFHYSGDYRIGTRYLDEPIMDNIRQQAMQVGFLRDLLRSDSIYIANNITIHNLEPISSFLGQLGSSAQGGLGLDEFLRRQHLHREAENHAMVDVASFMAKAQEIYGYQHFLNDTGGSVCELDSPEAECVLAENTVVLYIRADEDMEQELIHRSESNPKPMYYNEKFLISQLSTYLDTAGLSDADEMDPKAFARWIFPQLVQHRRPLYQALADKYGYTIAAAEAAQVTSEADFLELVEASIGRADS